jgi:hypothetical protein
VIGKRLSGDEDDEDECDKKERQFRTTLFNYIDNIEAAGSLATSGVIYKYPNPGICVDGGELTRLPLSAEDVRTLTDRSSKAPFSKNIEPSMGETVRKICEISAENINFQNPRWSDFVTAGTGQFGEILPFGPFSDRLSNLP